MNENKDKWVARYNDQGKFNWAAPYLEWLGTQFVGKVLDRTHFARMMWGLPVLSKDNEEDKELIWKIAQQEYENYKEELPSSWLTRYLP